MFRKKKEFLLEKVDTFSDNYVNIEALRLDNDEDYYVLDMKSKSSAEYPKESFFLTHEYEMMLRLEYRKKLIETLLEKLFDESKEVEKLNQKVYEKIVNELKMATLNIEPIETRLRFDYSPCENRVITSRRIFVNGFDMVYIVNTDFKTIEKLEDKHNKEKK